MDPIDPQEEYANPLRTEAAPGNVEEEYLATAGLVSLFEAFTAQTTTPNKAATHRKWAEMLWEIDVKGLSDKEYGRSRGVEPGTVRSGLHRARAGMRRVVEARRSNTLN